ncbi:MAG: GNAT family N-acetyltransferase [Candidatus Eremiobacteraeota bacterium]|nr:GNAT family N-acetyltransferase [Candidatus Eremiobacteraeota bacterium]
MIVRPLAAGDIPAWKRMRAALWPALQDGENDTECSRIVGQPSRFAVFVAQSDLQTIEGFVEASLREYADGCDTSPVGYLEGWFVQPQARRTGVGRKLVHAAETWARAQGCTEMGSDSILENVEGQHAHARLGYVEVERQVCFRKSLIQQGGP